MANASNTNFSSVHLLLAYLVVQSPARSILNRASVEESQLLSHLNGLGKEAPNVVDIVTQRAWQIVGIQGKSRLDSVVYLGALVSLPETLAHTLVCAAGINYRSIAASCGVTEMILEQTEPQWEERVTSVFGSVSDAEEQEAYATAVRGQLTRGRFQEAAMDASERRSRSPGRRQSDRLERSGKRQDRRDKDSTGESPFELDPKQFPMLTKLATNLSAEAALGALEPVIGRQEEITEIIDILSKRRSNNPLLIGEAGVGKTAVVEGVVARLVELYELSPVGMPKVVLRLDVGSIMAGTHLRGALSDRIRKLQAEMKLAKGNIYLYIDELHSLFSNQADGGADAANELKVSLARGEFPCIGATTIAEYREHIEADAALSRRFSTVLIEEPTTEATETIVFGSLPRYESHHGVAYEQEAVKDAIRLGRRYLYEERDPDRTLSILDWAGAIAKRSASSVTPQTIREVIARSARIPLGHLTLDASSRFLAIEATIRERILGQPHVAKLIGDTLVRNLAGFSGERPIGSMLFIGPTGVGKTEVVKTLAQLLFGNSDALTRFDMSEFAESHTVSRLIGSPPGYVGHQEGGQLTEAILRRPYQVVLLDEIEKAHRDIWNLLLQVTDEGHLSDSSGRRVDFSNTLLIMTSNLGAHLLKPNQRSVGFAATADSNPENAENNVLGFAKDALPLEFWNRLDARLVFRPLSRDTIVKIAAQLIEKSRQQIQVERGLNYEVSEDAVLWVVDHGGFDWELGARPLRSAIARWLETPISEAILSGRLGLGQSMRVDVDSKGLTFEVITMFDTQTLKPETVTVSP